MQRRAFLSGVLAATTTSSLMAALQRGRWEDASEVLQQATARKQINAAVLHISQGVSSVTRHFGTAGSGDAMFLLGSISKPINVAAMMSLFDQKRFQLDDRVQKYLPQFKGAGRETVTVRHLLTHVSGLPDQLPNNNQLRKQHAPLSEFVEGAQRVTLGFRPGSKYQYSSMGILLATRIAEVLSDRSWIELADERVFKPLGMTRSAQGLGRFQLEDMVGCQMEGAAPESGSGDPEAERWNWNSRYWRSLGVPWGGTHASAPDIGRFLADFLHRRGQAIRPQTAQLMTTNHNPPGFRPRGLGFAVGKAAGSEGCSDQTFGHTGSTGTLCWADAATETICVVLTSLPSRAANPHPRSETADRVAAAAAG